MKIGEAREIYAAKLNEFWEQKLALSKQKKALEENNPGSKSDGGKTVTTPDPTPAHKSLNFGYATYKGRTRNGKPDDTNGVLTFRSSHVIDSNDPKGRMADPGDYVIGQFSDGHLVVGTHYGADGVVKGKIIIGK